jgi:hypothetical protein
MDVLAAESRQPGHCDASTGARAHGDGRAVRLDRQGAGWRDRAEDHWEHRHGRDGARDRHPRQLRGYSTPVGLPRLYLFW